MVLFGMSLVYALGMRQFRILLIGYAVLVGMSLLGHGVRVRDEPADPVHARVFGGVAGGAVPAHGDDAERDPAAGLFLPGAEPADRPEEFAPPFCLYLPAAVMIRFIPTFLHDAKQVSETLRIRGWRMTPWNAFRHPVLLIRLVFTPLLFRSLKTSEELGIAAELKGLGYGEGMRPYRKLVWNASDTWLLVAACLVAAAAVLCQHAVGWPRWKEGCADDPL